MIFGLVYSDTILVYTDTLYSHVASIHMCTNVS